MPKKCSKEAFEQKLLARLSKQTSSLPLNLIKLCVKTYAGNRPRDWCNNKALKEKRSLAKKLVKTDENPVLLEYTLNKYIKKQYGGRITLREAYAQGGVLKHQVLLLKHSDYSTIPGFIYGTIRAGLYIYDSFKIESGGKVILEDPLENRQDSIGVAGLAVKGPNTQLINDGEIIVNNSIKANANVFGILCENSTCINLGTIHFKSDIIAINNSYVMRTVNYATINNNAYGVFGDKRASLENNGTINFNGKINSGIANGYAYGIYGCDSGNIENNGTISFQMIHSPRYGARGTYTLNAATVNNNGTINFNDDIICGGVSNAVGMKIGSGSLNNSGIINFEQNLIGPNGYVTGIEVFSNAYLTNNNGANINFNGDIQAGSFNGGGYYSTGIWFEGQQNAMTLNTNSLISFNSDVTFYPTENLTNVITGNGQILYNNDQTYYPPDEH